MDLREQFKARSQEGPKYEPVEVTGIGTVFVKRLKAGEKQRFESASDSNKIERIPAMLHGCFDERGSRIFEPEDTQIIEELDPSVVDPIMLVFMRLNGYTKESQDELAKNLNSQVVNS